MRLRTESVQERIQHRVDALHTVSDVRDDREYFDIEHRLYDVAKKFYGYLYAPVRDPTNGITDYDAQNHDRHAFRRSRPSLIRGRGRGRLTCGRWDMRG